MKCQYCGQKTATVHVKRVINGTAEEHHACESCAAQHGLHVFSSKPLTVDNVFGGLFAAPFGYSGAKDSCPVCGMTFREIIDCGKVGCSECYLTFYDQLQPTIRRIHGSATHVGKIAANGNGEHKKAQEIDKLKAELASAVEQQDFERCAVLRDRIKELEAEING